MSININGVNSLHSKFFNGLMASTNSMALSQFWLVAIDMGQILKIHTELGNEIGNYEPNMVYPANMDAAYNSTYGWFVGEKYCLLARSCQFPGDSIDTMRVGSDQSGNIKGLIGNSRSDMQAITISFLENNQSFVDLFLRPWMIYAGHKSLKHFDIRIPIELIAFQKMGFAKDFKIRKKFILELAVPVEVDSEEFNYTGDKEVIRQVKFAFSKYKVIDCTSRVNNNLGDQEQVINYILRGNPDQAKSDSFLDSLQSAIDKGKSVIDKGADVVNQIESKFSAIESNTLSLLNSLGMDTESQEVQKLFERLRTNTTDKVQTAINKADNVATASQNAKNIAGELTTTNSYNHETQVQSAVDNQKQIANSKNNATP